MINKPLSEFEEFDPDIKAERASTTLALIVRNFVENIPGIVEVLAKAVTLLVHPMGMHIIAKANKAFPDFVKTQSVVHVVLIHLIKRVGGRNGERAWGLL